MEHFISRANVASLGNSALVACLPWRPPRKFSDLLKFQFPLLE